MRIDGLGRGAFFDRSAKTDPRTSRVSDLLCRAVSGRVVVYDAQPEYEYRSTLFGCA